MIALVYPFLKLPRRFSFFDYQVPNGFSVKAGDLVRITFRGRSCYGLVQGIKATSGEKKLSSLDAVETPSWCTRKDIERFEMIADSLAQAVPSLLHALESPFADALPPKMVTATQAKKSVSKSDAEEVGKLLGIIEKTAKDPTALFADKETGATLAHVLRKKIKGQMLVLLARERDAELIAKTVSFGDKTAMMHGKTPPKERARIAKAWRIGNISTLITTKSGSLIPAKKIDCILVLDAGLDDHLNLRRNPRIDARESAKLLANQHGAKLIFLDNLPRLEEIRSVETLSTFLPSTSPPLVLSLKDKLEYTGDPLITETLLEEVKKALQSQKKVLLFLNRKGVAKRLQCSACGHLPLCGTCGNTPTVRLDDLVCDRCGTEMWIPKNCPHCGKPKIGLKGIGGAKIEDILKSKFPDSSIGRIEKGSLMNTASDIIIATEYFFSSYLPLFAPQEYGLVVDLAADVGLHGSDFRASENTARKIHRLIDFGKRQRADVIIQTWLPDTVKPMLDLPRFIKDELAQREKYRLPPYATRVVLEKAKLEDLPEELKSLFVERHEILETRFPLPPTSSILTTSSTPHPAPSIPPLTALPDSIKIQHDGPYVNHDRTPQSK